MLVWFVQSGLKAQPRDVVPFGTVAQLHPLSVIMVDDTPSINAKSPIRNISYQGMRTEMIQIFTRLHAVQIRFLKNESLW